MEVSDVVFEQLLLTIKECFAYKVPPLRSANGHRAEDWNLAHPLFTGALRVYQLDLKLKVAVYSYKDPTTISVVDDNIIPFAECHIEVPPKGDITSFVDSVIDSSRYYVLRLRDPKQPTRTALIGIGFRERESSFDFKNALNDYVRYVDRMATAAAMAAARERGEATVVTPRGGEDGNQDSATTAAAVTRPRISSIDYSIKQGEKIKIKSRVFKSHTEDGGVDGVHSGITGGSTTIGSGSGDCGSGISPRRGSTGSGMGLKLAPPPPPGSIVHSGGTHTPSSTSSNTTNISSAPLPVGSAAGYSTEEYDYTTLPPPLSPDAAADIATKMINARKKEHGSNDLLSPPAVPTTILNLGGRNDDNLVINNKNEVIEEWSDFNAALDAMMITNTNTTSTSTVSPPSHAFAVPTGTVSNNSSLTGAELGSFIRQQSASSNENKAGATAKADVLLSSTEDEEWSDFR